MEHRPRVVQGQSCGLVGAGCSQAEHSPAFWPCSPPACSAPVVLLPCAYRTAAQVGAPGDPMGAWLGMSCREGDPILVFLPGGCLASARRGTGGRAASQIIFLLSSALLCTLGYVLLHLHYPASTSDEFCSHFITYCSISATFSAVLHIGSTFPSPEQLSISGRFCHVSIILFFPDNGFYCRTIGPVRFAEHPLPGQLSMPPFQS